MTDLPAYSPRLPMSDGLYSPDASHPFESPPSYATASRSPPMSRRTSAQPSSSQSARAPMPRPTFTIGNKRTPALLATPDLKAHLVILRHFWKLREDVMIRARKSDLAGAMNPEDAWKWFLCRAVWRLQLWLSKVVINDETASRQTPHRKWMNKDEIPPLDVILIWHSYLLHPRTYLEDGVRYNMGLLMRGSFPLHEIARMLEEDQSPVPGSAGASRSFKWESSTDEPWHYATSPTDAPVTFSMPCPACGEAMDVPWLHDNGTGWVQDNFRTTCELCRHVITKEILGVAKFANDLRRVVEDPQRHTLATMHLHAETGRPSIKSARLFNHHLRSGLHKSSFYPDSRAFAARDLKWSLDEVAVRCQTGFMGASYVKQCGGSAGVKQMPAKGVQQILSAYMTLGPISIDLAAAARRHMRFVDKIVELGWTDYGRFENENDESTLPLKRAVAQYHAFLDVMAFNPDEFLVPTVSIDLAWHTHQLLCVEYSDNMMGLLGTIVDHDDAVEREALASAFDQTTRLWMNRHSIPYSVCGCPVPCIPAQKTNAVTKLFSRKGKGKAGAGPPAIVNPRPDLLSHQGTDVYETHPSDHGEVAVSNNSALSALQTARERTIKKRLAEDQEAVESGNGDPWQGLVVGLRKSDEGGHHERAFCAEHEHDLVDLRTTVFGQCVMGIGAAGLCQGGNRKMRAEPMREQGDHSLAYSDLYR